MYAATTLKAMVSDEAAVLIRYLGRYGSIVTQYPVISLPSTTLNVALARATTAPTEMEVTRHHYDLAEWAARGYIHYHTLNKDRRRNRSVREYEVRLTEPARILSLMLEELDG